MEELTFYVAGVQHHNIKDCVEEMEKGDQLNLVAEPENCFDSSAVRIEYSGRERSTMIGYVPRKFSKTVALALLNRDISCTLIELDSDRVPWEMCRITVKKE